jgi:hypothetical protein
LINAGFTAGVSFGAIVFGGLMPVIGWVRKRSKVSRNDEKCID